MNVINTLLSTVQVIKSPAFVDNRGGFVKLFNQQDPLLNNYSIQQVNFVQNKQAHILRGLHYQTGTWAEAKFFRVLKGSIQLGVVDIRTGVAASDLAATIVLDQPDIGVLVPRGFATGYLTLSPATEVLYFSDNVYHPAAERGICWNDPAFALDWQTNTPDVSEKDAAWAPW
ncbi:MAG: dTDP-4-dehydrorhamnose 3,5-epimerase family protein [Aureispira sp.]